MNDNNIKNLDIALLFLNKILVILERFENNYDKILNLSKLVEKFNISKFDLERIVSLIIKFQTKLNKIFINYEIKKKYKNDQVYIYLKKKQSLDKDLESDVYHINYEDLKLFNDIFYIFMVRKGDGFIPNSTKIKFYKDLYNLINKYPFLFEKNGNSKIYPSKIGIKLGENLLSYNNVNKKINNFKVDNYQFIFN